MIDVLNVSELILIFLSITSMEDSGYAISFESGWVLIRSKGSGIASTQIISVREGRIYRLYRNSWLLFDVCMYISML